MLLAVTLVNCDSVISGLGVTNWMVCLCKLVYQMPGCYSNILLSIILLLYIIRYVISLVSVIHVQS